MDLRAHEGSAGMMGNQKRDVKKYFFMLPNAVFELGLHVYELAIYAYLLRVEDRTTYQCIVSYPTIADKLGIISQHRGQVCRTAGGTRPYRYGAHQRHHPGRTQAQRLSQVHHPAD